MTADLSYVSTATVANDFSITSASAPALFGTQAAYVGTVIAGPSYTAASVWTLTAAGDGTTATVTIMRTTVADGTLIIREVA